MAQTKVYSIKINGIDQAVNSIDDLEKGVQALDAELKSSKIGSKEFKDLQKQVAAAKSELKDFELQAEGLDKEQRGQALVGTFNGLVGAVGAASSAFLAFGVDSEAIEEVERKLLGVVGVVQGLTEASQGVLEAQKLINASSGKLGSGLGKAFTSGIKGASGLKVALVSTGIGALIVAVGLLIAYWDEFVELVGLGTDEMKKYDDALLEAEAATAGLAFETQYYNSIVQDTSKSEGEREVALKELNKRGIATEDITLSNAEALDDLNSRVEKNIKLIVAKAKAEASAKLLSEALEEQLKIQGSSLEDNISWWEKTANVLVGTMGYINTDALNTLTAAKNKVNDLSEATEEVERATGVYKSQLEALIPLEAENAATQSKVRQRLEQRKSGEEDLAKAIDNRKAAEDAALKIAQDTEKALAVLNAKGIQKEIELIDQGYAERLAKLTEVFGKESQEVANLLMLRNAEVAAARQKYGDDATAAYLDLVNEIDDAVAVETAAVRQLEKQRTLEYYNDLIEEAKSFGLSTLELEEAKLQKLAELTATYADEDEAKRKEIQDKKDAEDQAAADLKQGNLNAGFDMALAAGDAIMALNEAFAGDDEASQKKAFEANKKVQLAQAVISTIQGTQNAFTTASASPFAAVFPAYPFIQAGIAAAFGLSSLKKIQSSTFQSTTAPAGGGGGGGAAAPAMNGASSNSLGGPNTSNGGRNFRSDINAPAATKTYVLAGDVTTAQQAEDKINQRRVF